MKLVKKITISLWLPATAMMVAIFVFSSIPSDSMPSFDWADFLVKKGGHMLGYGLLALAYLYAFKLSPTKLKIAWVLAFLYAISDEFHQTFVLGRQGSWMDIAIDSIGATIALLWAKKKISFQKK
ncbi:MAG: VanZ family protein [Anaerolineae bacterium]|jgi:VanZ family protein|nr:VanZ family protein [Anaerolineae bacterium]MBT7190960.1 VanZ family protein [Anaerolineae bacterium]